MEPTQGLLIPPLCKPTAPSHIPPTLHILNPWPHLICHFIFMQCSSLSLIIFFALKYNLSIINIAIPTLYFFQLMLIWYTFPFFYFLPTYIVEFEVTFLQAACSWITFFHSICTSILGDYYIYSNYRYVKA